MKNGKDKEAIRLRKKERKANEKVQANNPELISQITENRIVIADKMKISAKFAHLINSNDKFIVLEESVCTADEAYSTTLRDMAAIEDKGIANIPLGSYSMIHNQLTKAIVSKSYLALKTLEANLRGIKAQTPDKYSIKIATLLEATTFANSQLEVGRISWWNLEMFFNNKFKILA